jgi:hypothetical protein
MPDLSESIPTLVFMRGFTLLNHRISCDSAINGQLLNIGGDKTGV